MFTTLWYCRNCQKHTSNYRTCQRCHKPAEHVTFELVEVPEEKDPAEYVQVSLIKDDLEANRPPSQLPLHLAWRQECTTDAPTAEPSPKSTALPSDTDGL